MSITNFQAVPSSSGKDMFLSAIRIREMKRKEVYDFLSVIQENGYYCISVDVAKKMFDSQKTKFLVAVSPSEYIIGTCWLKLQGNLRGITSALAVRKDWPFDTEVYLMLLNEAEKRFSNVAFDVNIPTFLCPVVQRHSWYVTYKQYWDIRLYCIHTDNLRLRESEHCALHSIAPVNETDEDIIIMHYSFDRGEVAIPFISRLQHTQVGFKLTQQERVVGCGRLIAVGESAWVIGPVTANTQIAAKYIFDSIIRHARSAGLKGIMFVYVLEENTVAKQRLADAGFTKCSETWRKSCSRHMPDTDLHEIIYKNAYDAIFAFSPMFLHYF